MNLVKVAMSVPQRKIECALSRGMTVAEAKREIRAIAAELACNGIQILSQSATEVRLSGRARIWIY